MLSLPRLSGDHGTCRAASGAARLWPAVGLAKESDVRLQVSDSQNDARHSLETYGRVPPGLRQGHDSRRRPRAQITGCDVLDQEGECGSRRLGAGKGEKPFDALPVGPPAVIGDRALHGNSRRRKSTDFCLDVRDGDGPRARASVLPDVTIP